MPGIAVAASTAGFWSSSAAVPVVAGLVAALAVAAVGLVLRRPSRRAVRVRVGSFESSEPVAGEEETELGRRRADPRGAWWQGFEEAVAVSRSPHSARFLMQRAGLIALLLAPLCGLLAHRVGLAVVPLFAFPFVERWRVMRAAQRQRNTFSDTLPSYLQDMASAIRVGRSLVGAMASVIDGAEEPIRSEFERVVTDESLGRPLEESLLAMGERMRSAELDQVALVAELGRRAGSNVAEALDRVADDSRDRADLRREVSALTAQARLSSSVLTGLPVVLLIALSLIAPSYSHPLFHTTLGLIVLVVGAVLVFCGWKIMGRISRVEI
jgi:Flp pilus assembly protein TadB